MKPQTLLQKVEELRLKHPNWFEPKETMLEQIQRMEESQLKEGLLKAYFKNHGRPKTS